MHWRDVIKDLKPEFKEVISDFKKEIAKLRTSRPSTSLVEDLEVESYGKKVPLKSLGMIDITKDREIIVKPWDKSYMESIEKAIHNSSLGLSPITGEEVIRIPFPALTQERREKYLRLLSEKQEKAKKKIRDVRNKGTRRIENAFSKSEIGEDEKFRGLEKLQEVVDDVNAKLTEIKSKKAEIIKEG